MRSKGCRAVAKTTCALLLLVAATWTSRAAERTDAVSVADNALLKTIFDADQMDRTGGNIAREPVAVLCRDRQRRDIALEQIKAGRLQTASDYFHAAMVLQHSLEDIRLAHALSTIATVLDPDRMQYRWLTAASWDRLLVQHAQPQWYGTQYHSDEHGMFLYPVAQGAVSDAERRRMGAPPLAEAEEMVRKIPAMEGREPRKVPPPTLAQLQARGRPTPPELPADACKEK